MQLILLAAFGIVFATHSAFAADGDPGRGQRVFGACAPCHSLEPNKNMTGPSLSGLWNRQAGKLPGFDRYSPALKDSKVTWEDKTLDAWIADPQKFIPENHMTFRGIKDARQRNDLLAFLKNATRPGAPATQTAQQGGMGMMGGGKPPNLKKLDPEDRVQTIRYCRDAYEVTTADGKSEKYWERNLRFKTDSSEDGPDKGAPAIIGAGMQGDRASVIFAAPEEISSFIVSRC
ncbi:MAG: cytochrome c [Alphaproteobacteria bacterium]|jgi:cytochrome c|nr:cytochrome c [Alphaproteobacteria bacterium]